MNENEISKTALFVSPHLDDAVFSCGGTMAKLAESGWRTILCTVFTKSVADPKGFALACQLDKNLAPEIDYMKLRRAEDCAAARILNVSETLHLNFAEAPHRGYHSAPELFAGVKSGDEIWKPIAEHFALLDDIHEPELVFAPQGLGSHCDHLQTIDAVLKSFAEEKMCWYFDTPYAIRQPAAKKYHRLSQFPELESQNITDHLDAKIEACAAYRSQIDFQFGGRQNLKISLADFHLQSLNDSGSGEFVENFLAGSLRGRKKIG